MKQRSCQGCYGTVGVCGCVLGGGGCVRACECVHISMRIDVKEYGSQREKKRRCVRVRKRISDNKAKISSGAS